MKRILIRIFDETEYKVCEVKLEGHPKEKRDFEVL
jgi:hypothetical protein